MRRAEYRTIMLTQKFDCRCFYRSSKTNKRAKSTSNKLIRRLGKQFIQDEITQIT